MGWIKRITLIIAILSALGSGSQLISPIVMVPQQFANAHTISPSPSPSQSSGFQLEVFVTPVFQAGTSLTGDVSICCMSSPPSNAYNAPSVFIMTDSEYAIFSSKPNNFPSTSAYEATTFGALSNYTWTGETQKEAINISFTVRETSVYYFLVIGKGETTFTLNLVNRGTMMGDPYAFYFQVIIVVAAVAAVALAIAEIRESK